MSKKTTRSRPTEGELFAIDPPCGNETNTAEPNHELDPLFERLACSTFRSRFRLKADDILYIKEKGWTTIHRHAADFIRRRLAPACPPNDGRQTPMRGHPVFIAQHATACCCRGCLEKWHGIPRGHELTEEEQRYAVNVIMEWIRRQTEPRDTQSNMPDSPGSHQT